MLLLAGNIKDIYMVLSEKQLHVLKFLGITGLFTIGKFITGEKTSLEGELAVNTIAAFGTGIAEQFFLGNNSPDLAHASSSGLGMSASALLLLINQGGLDIESPLMLPLLVVPMLADELGQKTGLGIRWLRQVYDERTSEETSRGIV